MYHRSKRRVGRKDRGVNVAGARRRSEAAAGGSAPDTPAPARKDGKRPTMRDVARASGVSLMTVSRVINNEPTVQPEYVDRVLAAAVRLGFRRNNLARDLRYGRDTATIGLVI